ncbi:hypothetical protein [Planococcus lenghuensis]|uniref:Uncharacterized protein n=1 Tax=Planococcus lenghuensis TaxID=2213202 RepID=A0A1Q2L0V8_9BACL|nr:hypothetical protein [Planococcus lenghuensis]AQQ54061.1 hypothetical protein B0X71_13765 [Planococcus lenghuensis]
MDREAEERKRKYEKEMKRKRQRIVSPEIGISPDTKRLRALGKVVLKQADDRRIIVRRNS